MCQYMMDPRVIRALPLEQCTVQHVLALEESVVRNAEAWVMLSVIAIYKEVMPVIDYRLFIVFFVFALYLCKSHYASSVLRSEHFIPVYVLSCVWAW